MIEFLNLKLRWRKNMVTKVGFVDTFLGCADLYFMDCLSKLDIIRDDENPDILFFGDENFGTKNKLPQYQNCKRIFFTGENRRWTNYKCDYGIGFDHEISEKYYRLPLYAIDMWELTNKFKYSFKTFDHAMDQTWNIKPPLWDRKFCGFVHGNGGCVERNNAFHKISSEIEKIDSAGPLFNNVGFVLPRGGSGVLDKIKWLSNYRFTLCYENGSYPGYVTEKILHAYLAKTIPIYWGSPTIGLDFPTKTMISRHYYLSDEDFISAIKMVNSKRSLYEEFFSCIPEFLFNNTQQWKFAHWFENIVMKGK